MTTKAATETRNKPILRFADQRQRPLATTVTRVHTEELSPAFGQARRRERGGLDGPRPRPAPRPPRLGRGPYSQQPYRWQERPRLRQQQRRSPYPLYPVRWPTGPEC